MAPRSAASSPPPTRRSTGPSGAAGTASRWPRSADPLPERPMPDAEFTLLGDACWLDFVNTTRGRTEPAPDLLPDPAAYHRWTKAQKLGSDVELVPFQDIVGFRRQLVAMAEALA